MGSPPNLKLTGFGLPSVSGFANRPAMVRKMAKLLPATRVKRQTDKLCNFVSEDDATAERRGMPANIL
jgi:hypothetical protein